jgi:hypothetical protein
MRSCTHEIVLVGLGGESLLFLFNSLEPTRGLCLTGGCLLTKLAFQLNLQAINDWLLDCRCERKARVAVWATTEGDGWSLDVRTSDGDVKSKG